MLPSSDTATLRSPPSAIATRSERQSNPLQPKREGHATYISAGFRPELDCAGSRKFTMHDELMQHALDIRLRLQIDEAEIRPGETPSDTAERLLREIITANDEIIHIRPSLRRS
jgi:hypothetical protein